MNISSKKNQTKKRFGYFIAELTIKLTKKLKTRLPENL